MYVNVLYPLHRDRLQCLPHVLTSQQQDGITVIYSSCIKELEVLFWNGRSTSPAEGAGGKCAEGPLQIRSGAV